jgi:hypothetical protein
LLLENARWLAVPIFSFLTALVGLIWQRRLASRSGS